VDSRAKAFLDEYLATLPVAEQEAVVCVGADHFCDDRESATRCSELVLAGVKVATCSQKHWYRSGEIPMPQVGHFQVITDWDGRPTSIIETISVEERKFCDVDEAFAFSEGEGDRSLADWRRSHWAFFERECSGVGISFTEDSELVLERFKVVYPVGYCAQSR
jgi:uncharacterized protein YhfF